MIDLNFLSTDNEQLQEKMRELGISEIQANNLLLMKVAERLSNLQTAIGSNNARQIAILKSQGLDPNADPLPR